MKIKFIYNLYLYMKHKCSQQLIHIIILSKLINEYSEGHNSFKIKITDESPADSEGYQKNIRMIYENIYKFYNSIE